MNYAFKHLVIAAASLALFSSGSISCFSADEESDSPKKPVSKELAEIQAYTSVPQMTNPDEFVARLSPLARQIPTTMSPDVPEGTQTLAATSAALRHFQFLFLSEPRLRTPKAATLLADAWVRYAELLTKSSPADFKRQPTYLNMAPPPQSGIPAGGDPESIRDPAKRKAYETAIAQNEANSRINKFHSMAKREMTLMAVSLHNLARVEGLESLVSPDLLKKVLALKR